MANGTLHTSGGSSSTNSSSHTHTSTVGGSTSETFGKTWASGKVEDKTQFQRDKFNNDYQEGQKVQQTYQALQNTLDNKPTFQSTYQDKLNNLYDQIMNREKFNYNFNVDPMYQMYKDQYQQSGKMAMQDTMGQAAAMTGGYNSSYAQAAGQQQYQNAMRQLNTDVIPELRNQAYQQYMDEGNELMNKYGITNDAYNREYGEYRDTVSDWQNDRNFNYGMYSDERNFDYGQFQDNRNYWAQEYWNEKNAEQSSYSRTDNNYWEEQDSTTNSSSTTNQTGWDMSQPLGATGGGGTVGRSTAAQMYKKAQEDEANAYRGAKVSASTTGNADYTSRPGEDSYTLPYSSDYNLSKAVTSDIAQTTAIMKDISKNISTISELNDYLKEMRQAGYSSSDTAWLKNWAQKSGYVR